jgi:spectinomycin phosphotransferase
MSGELELRAWLREDFGLEVVSLERVRGGADENAALWRARDEAGVSYAVKWSSGGSSAGLVVSAHLARLGVAGVPAPIATRAGRAWSERAGRRLSATRWLSDARALDAGMSERHWTAFGALLARVHAAPVPEPVRAALPLETHGHERAALALRALERCARGDDVELVERARSTGRLLLERADALAPGLRARPMAPVICHGDPHLLNLLREGERLWLIDWDDAALAPRERDLLFVLGGGVLPFAPVGEREQGWFLAGYGDAVPDPERLAYHRCVRALEDLALPALQLADPERATELDRDSARAAVRGGLSATGLAWTVL